MTTGPRSVLRTQARRRRLNFAPYSLVRALSLLPSPAPLYGCHQCPAAFPALFNQYSAQPAMLERFFSSTVNGDRVAVSDEHVLVGRQAFESDRPARVQFSCADAKLCAEAVAKAVGETRRGVVIDARRINALQKKSRPIP